MIKIALHEMEAGVWGYPGTTGFRPPKKYFVSFYLLSSPIVLVITLYYLSVQEQQI